MPLVDRKLQLENDIKKYLRKKVGERKLENSSSNADILTGAFNKPTLATAVISQLPKLNTAIEKGAMSCKIDCPPANLRPAFEKYWVSKGYILAYTNQQKSEMFISWFGGAIWRMNWLAGEPKENHRAIALRQFMMDTVGDNVYNSDSDNRYFYSRLSRFGGRTEEDAKSLPVAYQFIAMVDGWIWINPKFGKIFTLNNKKLLEAGAKGNFTDDALKSSEILLK